MACCVGVMAYNEEANIAASVRSLLAQSGPHVTDLLVIVVASGCTDDTVPRALTVAAEDPRVRVIEEARREGKAAAIVTFLEASSGAEILALAGADTILEPGALEALVAPFDDSSVGMTGGHPIPVNDRSTLMGRVVNLLWELHHAVALKDPKLGELVAFRPVFGTLPRTAVDEAAIEATVRSGGLRLVYSPGARVRMKGPCTARDYLAQRRRIHAGHRHLRRSSGHEVSTFSLRRIARTVWRARPRDLAGTTALGAAIGLEATARVLGTWDDRVAGRSHDVWERIPSTKDLTL